MIHECIEKFATEKIDNCSGEAYNMCEGIKPMLLSIWFKDTDGIEEYCDNWTLTKVNFCPFCGIKSE